MSDPLVDIAWLLEHLQDPDVVVAEVCWTPAGSSRELYEQGHLPGAVFLDVDVDLAAPPGSGPGRHPIPSPPSFAATMGATGIRNTDLVVAYDRQGGSLAARLWWMLDVTGHRAAVLDGGLDAWTGVPETGAVGLKPASFEERPWPSRRVIDAEGVTRAIATRTAVVLDARVEERYRGEVEPIDPVGGHVPGALSAPWVDNLDPAGRFLPAAALRERFVRLGVREGKPVVCYCGSGVTSCHDVLALELAGLGEAMLYEGSWSDWCSDPKRPVARGPGSRGD